MADSPEVPDLKKALEKKEAEFAWQPGSTIAKSSASAAGVSARAGSQSALERFKAMGPGKYAVIAVVLMLGGLVFSVAAIGLTGASDGGGGTSLGGIASSMKVRFGRPSDMSRSVAREKAPVDEKMRFDLIKGGTGATAEADGAAGQAATAETVGGGGEGLNHGIGTLSQSSGGGGGAGGAGAAALGKDGGAGGSDVAAGGAGAKSGSAFSSTRLQGVQRVGSSTNFRGIGRNGMKSRSINTQGSGASAFGAGNGRDGASGGSSASAGGHGAGAGGLHSGSGAGGGGAQGGGAAGGGGGGGGGGGTAGNADLGNLGSAADNAGKIADLSAQAKDEQDKAEDAKKKAIILQAAGQTPQAIYEMSEYKKHKDAADKKNAEADRLTAEMSGAADAIKVTPAH